MREFQSDWLTVNLLCDYYYYKSIIILLYIKFCCCSIFDLFNYCRVFFLMFIDKFIDTSYGGEKEMKCAITANKQTWNGKEIGNKSSQKLTSGIYKERQPYLYWSFLIFLNLF